jgi:hypothetical protein
MREDPAVWIESDSPLVLTYKGHVVFERVAAVQL